MVSAPFQIPPRLHADGLPPGEQVAAHVIQSNLLLFASHVTDFQAALSLFDFCRTQMRAGPKDLTFMWPFVAARDGAMSVYHAYTVLDGIRETVAKTKELAQLVDREALKATGNIFHTHFRSFEDIRDAIAHAGDKMKKWLHNFGRWDEWIVCLTAGTVVPANQEQT